jgi:predicted Zn-dependent protease
MRNVLFYGILLPIFSFSAKPIVHVYVEKNIFADQFLFNLSHDFLENFDVDFQIIKIDSNRDNGHLLKSMDGSLLTDNNIVKEKNSYYFFLTNRPLTFGDTIEVRGLSNPQQRISIVSTHRIKIESDKFHLPFVFQFEKAVKHEFLHLLGLEHCDESPKCIMVASIPPSKFHYSTDRICPSCAKKIDQSPIKPKLLEQ